MKKTVLCLMVLVACLEGCVSTRFHDILSRAAFGAHYRKIIIHSNAKDTGTRQLLEDAVANQFNSIGIEAVPSYQVFSQGSNIAFEVKKTTIRNMDFDAALTIEILSSQVKVQQVIVATGMDLGRSASNVSTAHFKFETKLFETSDFEAVWQAQSGSREPLNDPSEFSMDENIANSYAQALVNELKNEGLVVAIKDKP